MWGEACVGERGNTERAMGSLLLWPRQEEPQVCIHNNEVGRGEIRGHLWKGRDTLKCLALGVRMSLLLSIPNLK